MRKLNIWMPLLLIAGLLVALPAFAATGEGSGSSSNPASSPSMIEPQGTGQFHAFNAGDLIGKTVKDRKGEELGKVEDVVIGSDGYADFVVLARGGFIDIGEKYVPVPFQTFMSNATNIAKLNTAGDVMVNLTKDKIAKAPSFSKDNLGNIRTSQDKICSYFGAGQCPHRVM